MQNILLSFFFSFVSIRRWLNAVNLSGCMQKQKRKKKRKMEDEEEDVPDLGAKFCLLFFAPLFLLFFAEFSCRPNTCHVTGRTDNVLAKKQLKEIKKKVAKKRPWQYAKCHRMVAGQCFSLLILLSCSDGSCVLQQRNSSNKQAKRNDAPTAVAAAAKKKCSNKNDDKEERKATSK